MVAVFFCEPTGESEVSHGFWCDGCNEMTRVVTGTVPTEAIKWDEPVPAAPPCARCSSPTRPYGAGMRRIYRRLDTGEVIGASLSELPGACFATETYDRHCRGPHVGPDGRALAVILPNGHAWHIDSRASNCTLPADCAHRCWVRSGRPEDGSLHVDKNGPTCAAGAGSIQSGDYHGFLHHGQLIPA